MLRELSLLSYVASILAPPVEFKRDLDTLRFAPDGSFQLPIFEDLHYSEGALKSNIIDFCHRWSV